MLIRFRGGTINSTARECVPLSAQYSSTRSKGSQDRFAIEIMAESALSLRAVGRPRLRSQEPPPEAKSRGIRFEELQDRDGGRIAPRRSVTRESGSKQESNGHYRRGRRRRLPGRRRACHPGNHACRRPETNTSTT